MSLNLYWQPKQPQGQSLCKGLKFALSREYFVGNYASVTMTSADVSFLRGVIAASSDEATKADAQVLIDAIETHGTIQVWLE